MNINVKYLKRNNQQEFQRLAKKEWIDHSQLNAKYVDNGIIIAGRMLSLTEVCSGVLNENKTPIVGSTFDERSPIDCNAAIQNESVDKVIFIGTLIYVWGHLITDGLKRLWFLETDEGRNLIDHGYKIAYTVATNSPLPHYAQVLFETLGYDFSNWIFVNSNTKFKEVVIPDSAMQIYKDGYRKVNIAFKRFLKTVFNRCVPRTIDSETYDKIYLSRFPSENDRFMGEQFVEKVFTELGYKSIRPEKLSFVQQFALFRNCTHLAGTEGSIMHNTIFCKPGTKIEIIRTGNFINDYQWAVNELIDADVTYIDANLSSKINKKIPNFGPFLLWDSPQLSSFANIKYSCLSFPIFTYINYNLRHTKPLRWIVGRMLTPIRWLKKTLQ